MISIALLLFILACSGIACASPGEDVQVSPTAGEEPLADTGDDREAMLAEPAGTTAYQGSDSVFSVFYNPVLLVCGLGAVIVLAIGYYLVRKSRGKDAP